jgi:hypothetical protein
MSGGTPFGRPCRATPFCCLPRAKALGCSIRPFHGQKRFERLRPHRAEKDILSLLVNELPPFHCTVTEV